MTHIAFYVMAHNSHYFGIGSRLGFTNSNTHSKQQTIAPMEHVNYSPVGSVHLTMIKKNLVSVWHMGRIKQKAIELWLLHFLNITDTLYYNVSPRNFIIAPFTSSGASCCNQ
jgi:hypothetical protein